MTPILPPRPLTIDSPILGLLAASLAVLVIRLTRRLNAVGRWLLRAAVMIAAIGVAGVGVRWERPLKVVAMVDVSPSTRGAAFRDERAVRARLTPLLAGRPFSVAFFADGPVAGDAEVASDRTRLDAPIDTDAVLLLSDGRFETAGVLPPTFAIVDPALDRPADARVAAISDTADGRAVMADVVGQSGRPLEIDTGLLWSYGDVAGPRRVTIPLAAATRDVGVRFPAGDAWPENDALRYTRTPAAMQRIIIGPNLPGFEGWANVAAVPSEAALAGTACVVLSTTFVINPVQRAALDTYVRELGGTLVLVGPPGGVTSGFSPLSAFPPAGPGRWVLLLDASGSMAASAGSESRWTVAVRAAEAALDRLPTGAKVSVVAFAGEARVLADDATVDDARRVLGRAAATPPGGPTGLRSALEAVAVAREPTRVLLLTDGDADLGDAGALSATLRAANVRVDAMTADDTSALARLCEGTGGRAIRADAAGRWATAFGGLADAPAAVVRQPVQGAGRGVWAGESLAVSARWPAWVKANADVLLDTAGGPVAAAWPVGLGRVAAVSAEIGGAAWAGAIRRLERSAIDPRFDVTWDETAGRVRLTAVDAGRPTNGLKPVLRRGAAVAPMPAVAPGVYEAVLERTPLATVGVVVVNDTAVSRRALAGRYAGEFDAVGNDRDALRALAGQTGGALIEAGDNRPIEFAKKYRAMSLQPIAAMLSGSCFVAALFQLRRRPLL